MANKLKTRGNWNIRKYNVEGGDHNSLSFELVKRVPFTVFSNEEYRDFSEGLINLTKKYQEIEPTGGFDPIGHFVLKSPKEDDVFMITLVPYEGELIGKMRFHGQDLNQDMFEAMVNEYHKPGLTHYLEHSTSKGPSSTIRERVINFLPCNLPFA